MACGRTGRLPQVTHSLTYLLTCLPPSSVCLCFTSLPFLALQPTSAPQHARPSLSATHNPTPNNRSTLYVSIFEYYASIDGESVHSISLNEWTTFLDDNGLVDANSKYCKRADMDRLFIVVDTASAGGGARRYGAWSVRVPPHPHTLSLTYYRWGARRQAAHSVGVPSHPREASCHPLRAGGRGEFGRRRAEHAAPPRHRAQL